MSQESKQVGTFYPCPSCGTGMNNVTDKVCPKCQWDPTTIVFESAHPAPVATTHTSWTEDGGMKDFRTTDPAIVPTVAPAAEGQTCVTSVADNLRKLIVLAEQEPSYTNVIKIENLAKDALRALTEPMGNKETKFPASIGRLPKQYIGRYSYDYRESDGVFIVCVNGHVFATAEDSEAACAISELMNRSVSPAPSAPHSAEALDDLVENLRKELRIPCWCEAGDEEGTVTPCHNCAFLKANIAAYSDSKDAQIAELTKELKQIKTSWTHYKAEEVNALEDKLEEARKVQLRHDKGESWFWQDDGYDFPESLNCPVIMQAQKVRDILRRAEAAESRAELAEAENAKLTRELKDAKKEAKDWKDTLDMYVKAWLRELGGRLIPKSHQIDAFVLTTRQLRERCETVTKERDELFTKVKKLESRALLTPATEGRDDSV